MMRESLENRYSYFDRKEGKMILDITALEAATAKLPLWTDDMEEGFIERMEEARSKREVRLKELDEEIMKEKFPFKPDLPKKSNEEEDLDYNGSTEFMRRLEEDIDKRRAFKAKVLKSEPKKTEDRPLAGPWKPT